MDRFREILVEPAELVATTRYVVVPLTAVGVPDITPVVWLMLKPDGRAGLTEYEITVPEIEGLKAAILIPFVKI